MSFTLEYLDYILLVFMRVSMIVYITPFLGHANIPRRVKACISIFLSIMVLSMMDYTGLSYDGILGYAILVVQEALTGLIIGLGSGMCMYILTFSGHTVDMEIGFSMAMEMDPATGVQTTLTSTLFTAVFMLIFLVSDMHYFVIDALFDSYELIPIGEASFPTSLADIFIDFMTDYFVIGFRIILPVFCVILVINVVLGIMAKVAPQMNMFVVGMQLKVFVGLAMLIVIVSMFSGVVDFIFEEMQQLTKDLSRAMAP